MTQEEKDLLLRDLCARLPYGVKCKGTTEELVIDFNDDIVRKNVEIIGALSMINLSSPDGVYVTLGRNGVCDIDTIKPYLRTMDSMTEDERKYLQKLPFPYDFVEGMLKLHFDFRGLIPNRLALVAPEGMYE